MVAQKKHDSQYYCYQKWSEMEPSSHEEQLRWRDSMENRGVCINFWILIEDEMTCGECKSCKSKTVARQCKKIAQNCEKAGFSVDRYHYLRSKRNNPCGHKDEWIDADLADEFRRAARELNLIGPNDYY